MLRQSYYALLLLCVTAAEKYPNIQYDEEIVDNACMQLVKDPSKFDVLVMPNLYGDIVRYDDQGWGAGEWLGWAHSAVMWDVASFLAGTTEPTS